MAPVSISESLKRDHEKILREGERLEELLLRLRYEGKVWLGKNMKGIQSVIEFFKGPCLSHLAFEEETLFPFLVTHIPKLEPLICLLQGEHEDFKKNLHGLDFLRKEFVEEREESERAILRERLRNEGAYLMGLLQSHIRAEEESIYQISEKELQWDEKEELERKIEEHRKLGR